MNEDQLSQVNQGRTASIILNWLDPVIKKLEEEALQRLKSLYRSGNYSESKLASGVAELIAIDSMKDKLKAMVNAADSISKEVYE